MIRCKENNQLEVGAVYQGSKIVDVQVEVSDRGKRVRQRSTITLENGAILKQDHFKDKQFEELDTKRRTAPPRTSSSEATGLPQRSLPKSKSGRHLPKPVQAPSSGGRTMPLLAESPARGERRRRSSSRGRDIIVCEAPARSKSDENNGVTASPCHNPRVLRQPPLSPGGARQLPTTPMTPERNKKSISVIDMSPGQTDEKKRSSLRNLSNFLQSPKRKPPTVSQSGGGLDAMRSSLHSCNSKASSMGGHEDTPRKPGSLKKLGKLMQKPKVQRSKSGDDLELMKEKANQDRQTNRRRSTATSESNKEKLKSFKEMIAASSNKSKPTPENGRRRSSLQSELPPVTYRTQRSSAIVEMPQPKSSPQREQSLSPEEVKKPPIAAKGSGSYVTDFLDKLYDSYIKDDNGEESDDESDSYANKSRSLLDMSLNKFVDWVE